MKKITALVSNDLTYDQRMHRICSSLTEAGYEVTLVGRKRKSSVSLSQKPFQQVRLNCFFEKGKLFYLVLNIRLLIFLLFKKYDAILAVDADTLLAASTAKRWKGGKLIFDAHEYFTEVPELVGRSRIQAIWRLIEKRGIPKAELCMTVSKGVAELYADRFQKPFHVLRNFPERAETSTSVEKIPDSIIYQGALNEGRGIEALIQVMEDLQGKLILAGEGDISGELKELTEKLKVSGKVEFLGYVEPNVLKKLTPRAEIGMNLLEEKGLSYFHSLANKFFAYVQAGIPQVCINFPEYRRLNAQFEVAILVDDLRKETLINAIRKLRKDRETYERLRANCKKAADVWNWEAEKEKLIRLVAEMH